jgi:hypothetical protein
MRIGMILVHTMLSVELIIGWLKIIVSVGNNKRDSSLKTVVTIEDDIKGEVD